MDRSPPHTSPGTRIESIVGLALRRQSIGAPIGRPLTPINLDTTEWQAIPVTQAPDYIYLSPPHLTGQEEGLIREAFQDNWIGPIGPHLRGFEDELANYLNVDDAVVVASGTAALHLALQVVGVEPGDEVIASTFTFVGTVNPIRYLGAHPIFVDSEVVSWNMDPRLLAEALEGRAKAGRLPSAVVVAHIYGQAADLDAILEACNAFGVPLVEDAAESLGALYRGRSPGTMGHVGIFSFNGNKIITTGGGGALVTRDPALTGRVRSLSTQARNPDSPDYDHLEVGYNYRMSNILAGVGRAQLQALDQRVEARRRIFQRYETELGGLPGVRFQPEAPWGYHSRWLTCLTVDPEEAGVDRESLRRKLEGGQIQARSLWQPMHRQRMYRECPVIGGFVADSLFERGLSLPSGSNLTWDEQTRVIEGVQECIQT